MPSVDVWPSEAWRQTHVYMSTHKLRCGMSHTRVLCHVEWTTRWDNWVVTTQTSRPNSFNVFYLDRICFEQQPLSLAHPSVLPCCMKSIRPALWLMILLWDLSPLWEVSSAGWSHTPTGRLLSILDQPYPACHQPAFHWPNPNVRSDSCMAWPGTASKPWDKPWRMCRAFPTG